MKVALDSQWAGLAHWEREQRYLDYFSSPDEWTIGFEIVYRIIFSTAEVGAMEQFKQAFTKAFGLSPNHYVLPIVDGGATYWRVYWDRDAFDLNRLERCESSMNNIAESIEKRVLILELGIVPRSREHIKSLVGANN